MTNLTIFERFLANKGIPTHVIIVPGEDVETVLIDCIEAGVAFQFEAGKLTVAGDNC